MKNKSHEINLEKQRYNLLEKLNQKAIQQKRIERSKFLIKLRKIA